jgi:YD repeat-containing protein
MDYGDVTHLNIQTSYDYDLTGNLTTITDPNLHETTYQYDALGRQSQKEWPGGIIEVYTYDKVV